MTTQAIETTVAELNDLLDAEREALLQGDLQQLNRLLLPKETLVEAIRANASADLPGMAALDRKARRNQLLLDGALEGIRAVAARMARLREVKGALETYGADGRKKEIPLTPGSSVERRA